MRVGRERQREESNGNGEKWDVKMLEMWKRRGGKEGSRKEKGVHRDRIEKRIDRRIEKRGKRIGGSS